MNQKITSSKLFWLFYVHLQRGYALPAAGSIFSTLYAKKYNYTLEMDSFKVHFSIYRLSLENFISIHWYKRVKMFLAHQVEITKFIRISKESLKIIVGARNLLRRNLCSINKYVVILDSSKFRPLTHSYR